MPTMPQDGQDQSYATGCDVVPTVNEHHRGLQGRLHPVWSELPVRSCDMEVDP
jgi:hypothetical protein